MRLEGEDEGAADHLPLLRRTRDDVPRTKFTNPQLQLISTAAAQVEDTGAAWARNRTAAHHCTSCMIQAIRATLSRHARFFSDSARKSTARGGERSLALLQLLSPQAKVHPSRAVSLIAAIIVEQRVESTVPETTETITLI